MSLDEIILGEPQDTDVDYTKLYLSVVFDSGKGREYPLFVRSDSLQAQLKEIRYRLAEVRRRALSGLVITTASGGIVYLLVDKLSAIEILTEEELFLIHNLRIQ